MLQNVVNNKTVWHSSLLGRYNNSIILEIAVFIEKIDDVLLLPNNCRQRCRNFISKWPDFYYRHMIYQDKLSVWQIICLSINTRWTFLTNYENVLGGNFVWRAYRFHFIITWNDLIVPCTAFIRANESSVRKNYADSLSWRMICLLVHVYTLTNYKTNNLFFAQVCPEGSSVSCINWANDLPTIVDFSSGDMSKDFPRYEICWCFMDQ